MPPTGGGGSGVSASALEEITVALRRGLRGYGAFAAILGTVLLLINLLPATHAGGAPDLEAPSRAVEERPAVTAPLTTDPVPTDSGTPVSEAPLLEQAVLEPTTDSSPPTTTLSDTTTTTSTTSTTQPPDPCVTVPVVGCPPGSP